MVNKSRKIQRDLFAKMHPILLFLTAIVCCCVAVRQQSVGVVGRLMCGDKPAAGVKVKLWDEDDGPDPDDLLDQGFTDAKGEFSLKGSERETTNIDPVFKVYHVTRYLSTEIDIVLENRTFIF
ncbi:hypothetical protein RB195_005229 [Necator americanus]|uniref:Transthyretin-like family protein n=1 Tax=Necator americanus TaxID=51031 RepID=A0ABR1BND8_NECAM